MDAVVASLLSSTIMLLVLFTVHWHLRTKATGFIRIVVELAIEDKPSNYPGMVTVFIIERNSSLTENILFAIERERTTPINQHVIGRLSLFYASSTESDVMSS